MKISKLSLILVVAIMAISVLATTVSAYTSAELANYITGSHTISGSQFELGADAKNQVKNYLANNPVTDAEAAQIKGLLDEAKNVINSTGASNLNQVSKETKAKAVSLIKQAGNVAGLTVSVNSQAKTVTVSDGATAILSGSYAVEGNGGLTVRTYTNPASVGGNNAAAGSTTVNKLVYTGSNNTVFAVVAVLAVVAVATVLVKKVNAK